MATLRAAPRINTAVFARRLTERLPVAVVTRGHDSTVTVEGPAGAYTVTLTAESHEEWDVASVDVALTQPPGFTEPLPPHEAVALPHGTHSLTSDFGRRLRVDHAALADAAAEIIKDFEVQSPSLSARATTC